MGMNNKFNCINKFHSNLNSINFVKIFESIMKIFVKSQKMNICSYMLLKWKISNANRPLVVTVV